LNSSRQGEFEYLGLVRIHGIHKIFSCSSRGYHKLGRKKFFHNI